MIRTFERCRPRIDPSAFVHDAAEVIGDVRLGAQSSIWPHAVLRGDVDAIRVGRRTNIQDCAVVHCREGQPAVIGAGVTLGHSAIVHGARVGDYCLVGMGAVVMEARIGRESLIAAGAVVLKGFKAPARSLIMGCPAKVVRRLNPREIRDLHRSEAGYVTLAQRHRRASRLRF